MNTQQNALRKALENLVQAVEYTPLGIRAIKAVEAARNALASQPAEAPAKIHYIGGRFVRYVELPAGVVLAPLPNDTATWEASDCTLRVIAQPAPDSAPAEQGERIAKLAELIGRYGVQCSETKELAPPRELIDALNALAQPVQAPAVPEGWKQAAEWLRNNYQAYATIADLTEAMIAAAPTANQE